jgi:hypothetical protein
MRLVGHRPVVGKAVAEALPEAAPQGFVALLDEVYRSGNAFTAAGRPVQLQETPGGPVSERLLDFVYQPIKDSTGQVTGIFVEGIDMTDRAPLPLPR